MARRAPVRTVATMSSKLLQTPVRDFMRPGVIAVCEDTSLRQAERAMVRHGVHAVLVLGREGRPLGWVTSRGMLLWIDQDLGLSRRAARSRSRRPALSRARPPARRCRRSLRATSRTCSSRVAGETPQGVVADADLISLCADG